MTALSGAERSSTVTSQWQPRSSKESSVVMPASTEKETDHPFIKKCSPVEKRFSSRKTSSNAASHDRSVQECFKLIQFWLSGGENLCPSWTRSLGMGSFFASSATVCKVREKSIYKSLGLPIITRVVDTDSKRVMERENKRKAKEIESYNHRVHLEGCKIKLNK